MEHQSAIEVLLAQARVRLDRVEPERMPTRWQPAQSWSIFVPSNNDSEMAS
jgi:hypothetical protein